MTKYDKRATEKAIWRFLDRVGGYQPFGWDWPTLRLTYPQIAMVLWECQQGRLPGKVTQE